MKKTITKGEVSNMRKKLLTMFFVFLSVVLVYGYAGAITGVCSNCHTMHNSQDGADVDAAGPNKRLLSASCVACHKEDTSGGQTNSFNAPIVWHTTDPTGQGDGKTLAGGDFYWVVNAATNPDRKGHNVENVITEDAVLASNPPGWDQTATTGLTFDGKTLQLTGGAGWAGERLTCAGTFGCHGTRDARDLGGLQGAHHNNLNLTATEANAVNTTDVGSSFRFLADIYGLEDANWNWNENTGTQHNEYFGANSTASRNYDAGATTYTNKNTVSFLCAECHGNFHSKVADDAAYAYGDPWRRHPTDIVLPDSSPDTEYELYNTTDGLTIGSYSVEAPVARGAVPSSASNTVNIDTSSTGAIVMCLSCHRAHGSDEDDLLRWDYTTMIAGGANTGGCFTCHTEKNAATAHP